MKPRKRRPVAERIMAKIEPNDDGCWIYTGSPNPVNGYCTVRIDSRARPAHRVAYETFVGPIPDGMEIDHLCHTWDASCPGGVACQHRRCVNPEHLEPVTHAENVRRGRGFCGVNAQKTHCGNGHEFTPENTITTTRGQRERRACRECEKSWRLKSPPRRKGTRDSSKPVTRVAPEELKTHCKNGHEFTPENTYIKPYWHGVGGSRECRACGREQRRAYRERRRAAKSAAELP